MAIDTAQKRFSVQSMFTPAIVPLFEADGAVDADDRYHLLGLYSGITLAEPAPTVVVTILLRSPDSPAISLRSPDSPSTTLRSPDGPSVTLRDQS